MQISTINASGHALQDNEISNVGRCESAWFDLANPTGSDCTIRGSSMYDRQKRKCADVASKRLHVRSAKVWHSWHADKHTATHTRTHLVPN